MPQRPEDAPAARNALIEAVSLIKTGGWLIVYEDKATDPSAYGKASYVRLSGVPQIASVNARGRHDFSIGLKAVDPIKYEFVDGHPDGYNSVTITAASPTATIENTGNVPVPIVIELSKGFTVSDPEDAPPTITNTENDQVITIIAGTSATNTLEIDTYNREILEVQYDTVDPAKVISVSNGRAKASVLIDWIYLEPGENEITLSDFPSGSTCTILYRSGWIG
jgi:phage-related protein